MSSNSGNMELVSPFVVKKYSSRSYKLSGDTFKYKSDLDGLGWYKKYLKGGPGYIIPNKNYPDLVNWLKKISGAGKPKKTQPNPKKTQTNQKKTKPKTNPNQKKTNPKTPGLGNLSIDTARMILFKSDPKEILNMCSVNRYYSNVVCNNIFWQSMIKNTKPSYGFSELPFGYSSWKLVYMTLCGHYHSNYKEKISVGKQIAIYRKIKKDKGVGYLVAVEGLITGISKTKRGKLTGIEYIVLGSYPNRTLRYCYPPKLPKEYKKGQIRKLVARGKAKIWIVEPKFSNSKWIHRMIDPAEYQIQQPKKNIANLQIQGFKVIETNPTFGRPNGDQYFHLGESIKYWPFRHYVGVPDNSWIENGPKYMYEVVGFDNLGGTRVNLTFVSPLCKKYTFSGTSNDEPVENDVIVYNGKRHTFKNNNYNESFYTSGDCVSHHPLDHFITANYGWFA